LRSYPITRRQSQGVAAKMDMVMVDWTILTPTYLTAMVEWAGAAVTVLVAGKIRQSSGERR